MSFRPKWSESRQNRWTPNAKLDFRGDPYRELARFAKSGVRLVPLLVALTLTMARGSDRLALKPQTTSASPASLVSIN